MSDGWALLEVNPERNYRLKDWNLFDIRMEGALDDDIDFLAEHIESQIKDDISDVLIMVTFTVDWDTSYHCEYGYECDGVNFTMDSYTIVKTDYKEFYRGQVTAELSMVGGIEGLDSMPNGDDNNYYKNLIADWEEFYDEDFVPIESKVPEIIELAGFDDLFTA